MATNPWSAGVKSSLRPIQPSYPPLIRTFLCLFTTALGGHHRLGSCIWRVGSENNPPSATCSLHSVLTVPQFHTLLCALISQLQILSFDQHSCYSYGYILLGANKKNVPLSPIRFSKLQLHARFNLLCPTHTFTNVVSRNSCAMKLLNYSRKTGGPYGRFGLDHIPNWIFLLYAWLVSAEESPPLLLAWLHSITSEAQNGPQVLVSLLKTWADTCSAP